MALITVNNDARQGGPVSTRGRKMQSAETIKAITTTTNAYTGLTSDWVPCDAFNGGMLYILIGTKDSTTIEVQIDISPDQGTTIAKSHYVAADSAGTAASAPTQQQFTMANYSNGDAIPVKLDLSGVSFFRVKVKSTGGNAATIVTVSWTGAVS